MHHTFPTLALACLSLMVWGCGTTTQWPESQTVPPNAAAQHGLLDCTSVDAALCTDADWAETEAVCQAATETAATAFHGHRCLAHVHLERSRRVVTVLGGGDDAATLQQYEAEVQQQRNASLLEALEHVEAARALQPTEPTLASVQLDLLEALDRQAELIALLPDVIALLSEADLTHMLRLADSALARGDMVVARSIAGTVLAQVPDHSVAAGMLGLIAYAEGDWDEAAKRLRVAMASGTDTAGAAMALVEVSAIRGDLQTAIEAAEQVHASDPSIDHLPTWAALAVQGHTRGQAELNLTEENGWQEPRQWPNVAFDLLVVDPMAAMILCLGTQRVAPYDYAAIEGRVGQLVWIGEAPLATELMVEYIDGLAAIPEADWTASTGMARLDVYVRIAGLLLSNGAVREARNVFDQSPAPDGPGLASYRRVGGNLMAAEGDKKIALVWLREAFELTQSARPKMAAAIRADIERVKAQP